jgi:hypothetical protein
MPVRKRNHVLIGIEETAVISGIFHNQDGSQTVYSMGTVRLI